MKRAYNVLRSDLTKCLEPLGLRITTYSSLNLIVENPGIRQSELALALDIERPNMVVILDDLEQRGWIDRRRVETDRRAYALTATLAGKRVCEKAVAADLASENRLLRHLKTEEKKLLLMALKKIEQTG
ncbi:MAG: MarR family transcriptional regulator [Rhizobiaceae bacterium]